jgi:hypothetical protein
MSGYTVEFKLKCQNVKIGDMSIFSKVLMIIVGGELF